MPFKFLLIIIPLLCLCSESYDYDSFWNPNTFSSMASKNSFAVNGSYLVRNHDQVSIRSIHQPTGIRGTLIFSRNEWQEKDSSICTYISLMFEADSTSKDAYSEFLKNSNINGSVTMEPEQAPVVRPGTSSTSTENWMRKDL